MKRHYILLLLLAAANVSGQVTNHQIGFERSAYGVATGGTFNSKVLISPKPPAGLFSGSFLVQITGSNTVGFSRVSLTPALDFDGPDGARGFVKEGVGWAAGQGTVDFFSPNKIFHQGEELGSVELSGLKDGDYTLELQPYPAIGTPDEVLFVDGNCQALDERISFKSATLTVGIIATAELMGTATLDPQSGLFKQTVKLTNVTEIARGNFRVLVDGIPANVKLWNSHGQQDGLPYVDYRPELAGGASVNLTLEYHIPSRTNPPVVSLLVLDSGASPPDPDATGAIDLQIRAEFRPVNGSFLLEFDTRADKSYILQYSLDMTIWKTVPSPVQGTGSRVQWIDNGPPKTDCHPSQCPNRFYRVIEQ